MRSSMAFRKEACFGQADYRIRFERGERGLLAVARDASVIIIVDVLSFSTAVDIAVARGASVKAVAPQTDAEAEAEQAGAFRAVSRNQRSHAMPYSLSPDTLSAIPAATFRLLGKTVF